ncbi:selenocysteine-specific elongation factor [Dethiosulfatibacter aminovorans DSM 17477]|uniref:Selenocysteine-specific elongation factor n=1 Tax=Dethiosulfatibacter aminovorans DSM 17477 TaxID=1121476 RepID=A0A1M6CZR5_9FIRM|nr:selenocysteine-specific translation elongation factor [Dethiosulfatibacter aminovorans]SHI66218.1 selenocysteine-specific elongation factor [Dethiosulfatibacter aminovorans DSM 17477]
MKNIIIGTAGHIDHGKTTLIKALTGHDTDRLKEEKERGITIDLGFSFFELSNGDKVGIIDVPGHEKFLNNMLSGVVGMDFILFVVAADEGVMPQTVEHLNILNLVGIKNGIIVITKKDIVDEEMLELVVDDIKENFSNTFLENAPVVEVSSKTGDGIEKLKTMINEYSEKVVPRDDNKPFRLPVDRVFTLKGIGTVVTGTIIEGSVNLNDELSLYPYEMPAKVRNIQVHGVDVDRALAGQRAAINISSLSKSDIRRGDLLAEKDSVFRSNIIDVELKNLDDSIRTIKNGSKVHFFVGTKETVGAVILFGKKELNPGEMATAQIRFDEDISVKFGDRFIVRFYSPLETIGGGRILDPIARRHKTSSKTAIKSSITKSGDDFKDIIYEFIREKAISVEKNDLYKIFSMEISQLENILEQLVESGRIRCYEDNRKELYMTSENYGKIKNDVLSKVKEYHNRFNLKPGINKETLTSSISGEMDNSIFNKVLRDMENESLIEMQNEFIRLYGYSPELSDEQSSILGKVSMLLQEDDMIVKKENIKEIDRDLSILEYLQSDGVVSVISNEYVIKNEYIDTIKDKTSEYIQKNGTISVAEIRDLLKTNRNKAVIVLEYLDKIKFTKRVDNDRILW